MVPNCGLNLSFSNVTSEVELLLVSPLALQASSVF